tara:strand:+ start:139 stop:699 length:561 start_codon:yes stop_codon:yes gene_type:complete
MKRFVYLISAALFLYSCGGKHEENQKKMKELYGCKVPGENLSKQKYRDCLAKEQAEGERMFDLAGNLNDLIRGENSGVIYQYSVNPHLWSASIEVTKSYPLKIADSQGGFIETEWINDTDNNSQRCLIKIQVRSKELISTGVSSTFICEENLEGSWVSDNKKYLEEEKQLTLKILEIAGNLSKSPS